MKSNSKYLPLATCHLPLLLALSLATYHSPLLFGQVVGVVTPATFNQTVLNAVSAPQASATIRQLGQSVHYLVYFTGGTVTSLSIQLEGSSDGVNWLRISETATNTVSGGVYANIYLPLIRANLTALSGTNPTVTAFYSGTSVTAGPPAGIFNTSSLNAKFLAVAAPANTTQTFTALPPSGNSAGTLLLSFSAPVSGATIAVLGGTDATHLATVLPATTLQNVAGGQQVFVGPQPANILQITYTAPGATAATYDLTYQFGVTDAVSLRPRNTTVSLIDLSSQTNQTIVSVSGLGAGQLNAIGCSVTETETSIIPGPSISTLDINIDGKGAISLPFISSLSFNTTGAGNFITNVTTNTDTAGTRVLIPFGTRFANTLTASINVSQRNGGTGKLSCTALYSTIN